MLILPTRGTLITVGLLSRLKQSRGVWQALLIFTGLSGMTCLELTLDSALFDRWTARGKLNIASWAKVNNLKQKLNVIFGHSLSTAEQIQVRPCGEISLFDGFHQERLTSCKLNGGLWWFWLNLTSCCLGSSVTWSSGSIGFPEEQEIKQWNFFRVALEAGSRKPFLTSS